MYEDHDEVIDLRELLLAIWRQRWLVIGVTLVSLLVSVLVSFASPRVYRVEALVELDKVEAQPLKQYEGKEILESRALLIRPLRNCPFLLTLGLSSRVAKL